MKTKSTQTILALLKQFSTKRGQELNPSARVYLLTALLGTGLMKQAFAEQIQPAEMIAQLNLSPSVGIGAEVLAQLEAALAEAQAGALVPYGMETLAHNLVRAAIDACLTEEDLIKMLQDVGMGEAQIQQVKAVSAGYYEYVESDLYGYQNMRDGATVWEEECNTGLLLAGREDVLAAAQQGDIEGLVPLFPFGGAALGGLLLLPDDDDGVAPAAAPNVAPELVPVTRVTIRDEEGGEAEVDGAGVVETEGTPAEGAPDLQTVGTISFTDSNPADTHSIQGSEDGVLVLNGDAGRLEVAVTTQTDAAGNGGVITYTYFTDPVEIEFLAEGEEIIEEFPITLVDSAGATSSTVVTIRIVGTNDTPVVTAVGSDLEFSIVEGATADSGEVISTPVETAPPALQNADLTISPEGIQTFTGVVNFNDVDISDTHTVTVLTPTGEAVFTPLGQFQLGLVQSSNTESTGQRGYTYTVNEAALNGLSQGDVVIENYTIRITDNFGAFVDQVITVTIQGTNDTPVIVAGGVVEGAVVESGEKDGAVVVGVLTADGKVTAEDVDNGAVLTYSTEDEGTLGTFEIDSETGDWIYTLSQEAADSLAEGDSEEEEFTVTVTDDKGATTTQVVTITITGTDDLPVIQQFTATGSVDEAALPAGSMSGNNVTKVATGFIEATDVDTAGLTVTTTGTPAAFGMVSVTAVTLANGKAGFQWTYTLTSPFTHPANNVGGDSFTLRIGTADSFVDRVVNISIIDDVPTAIVPATVGLLNQNGGMATGALVVDNLIEDNFNADASGKIYFSATLNGTDSGYKSASQAIKYYVSADGKTLVGATGANSTTGVVFTVTLNDATGINADTYSVVMSGAVDTGGVPLIFSPAGGYTLSGGNTAWKGFFASTPSQETGLDQDLLVTPLIRNMKDGSINSSQNQLGVGSGTTVGSNEAIRLDYVNNLRGDTGGNDYGDLDDRDHIFDNHYLVNGATVALVGGVSTVVFRASDDTNNNDVVGDGVPDPIIAVSLTFGTGTPIFVAKPVGSNTATVNPYGSGTPITVTFGANGEVTLAALRTGTSVSVFTADGYNSLVIGYVSGDSFALTGFGVTAVTPGQTFNLDIPVTIEDGDGDKVTSNLDIDLLPVGVGGTLLATADVTLNMTTSNDQALGSAGNDTINGSSDGNTIFGQSGNDTLNGNGGNDKLYGGDGDDTLNGGIGDDLLEGGNGVDTLNGDSGNDTLNGGNNNDILNGGEGMDTLTGGAGADRFVFDNLGLANAIKDFSAAQGDKIDFAGALGQFDNTDIATLPASNEMTNGKIYFESVNFTNFDSADSLTYLQNNFEFLNDGTPSQQNLVVLNGTSGGSSDAGIFHLTDLNNNGMLETATEVTFLGTVEDTLLANNDIV